MISERDTVKDLGEPQRGIAVVKQVVDGKATIWYPKFNLTVMGVRVRDLEKVHVQ